MSEFLNPDGEIQKHGGKLPHWQQEEKMQFVTFRLADSMPEIKLRLWKEERGTWLKLHPEPWPEEMVKEYHQRFTTRFERWLDEGSGSCLLKDPANRTHLEETLMHDQHTKAIHHSWSSCPTTSISSSLPWLPSPAS